MSLLVNLERVYLTFDGLIVDDDMSGASCGDGDGLIEYDETIELTLVLRNAGQIDAHDVSADVGSFSAYVEIETGHVEFGSIPSGCSVASATPLVFHVAHDVPNGEILAFQGSLSEAPGQFVFTCEALAPVYLLSISEIDDSAGNGDGVPDPGETVILTLRIENAGDSDSPDVEAVLQSRSDYFVSDESAHPLGVLAAHETYLEGGFSVEILSGCPPVLEDYLQLVLNGPNQYVMELPLILSVGSIFADDMESGDALWTHYPGVGDWYDQWHLSTYNNHTPDGQWSWKCGGAGGIGYANRNYSLLETAEFDLPTSSRLEFWHRMGAQTNPNHPGGAFDGGLIEISTDGGSVWEPLVPVGGYPHVIEIGTAPSPLPEGTPVWSGSFDWTQARVYLGAYTGPVQIRWVFGSDGSGVSEGWFVDDVHVSRPPASGVNVEVQQPHLTFYPARPNPALLAASGIALHFHLPTAAVGRLAVFDANGRLRQVLASGPMRAGEHRITWDGRNAAGFPVPAGVYYLRLSTPEVDQTQSLIVIR